LDKLNGAGVGDVMRFIPMCHFHHQDLCLEKLIYGIWPIFVSERHDRKIIASVIMGDKLKPDFIAATLMINNTSPRMLQEVIAWLKAQAVFLQYSEKQIDKKYVIRYIPVRGFDEN